MTATQQESVVVNDSKKEWTSQLRRHVVGTSQLEGSDSVHVSTDEDRTSQLHVSTDEDDSNHLRVLRCCCPSCFFGGSDGGNDGPGSSHYLVLAWNELVELCKTMFPALVGLVINKIPWLISLRFVGEIGADELAATALAVTLSNVTGLSLSDGLSSALSTLTGQSWGSITRRKHSTDRNNNQAEEEQGQPQELHVNRATEISPLVPRQQQQQIDPNDVAAQAQLQPVVFLFRGLFILAVIVGPMVTWWIWGIGPVLIALGQNPKLSLMTEQYLRILAPGLLMYCIGWTITAWLQAIQMADIPATAAVVALCTHIPLNIFYIHILNWGYLGAAAATTTYQIIQASLIVAMLLSTKSRRQRLLQQLGGRSIDGRCIIRFSIWMAAREAVFSLSGIVQYLGLALPGIVIISEWWASEVTIFLAGHLSPSPEIALGAMTLYQSINVFCFMLPRSCNVAAATRVSNLLGAGKAKAAAFSGYVALLLAASGCAILVCILFFTPHTYFSSLFAPDEKDLILATSRTIPLLSLYVFVDGLQITFYGIIKGCGRQLALVPIVIVAYWIVGVPLAYWIAFVRHEGIRCYGDTGILFCGELGLITGLTVGTCVHMILVAVVVIGMIDWHVEATKAKQRVLDSYS